jgi:myo-inositol 2-dehydrogenase / D-chiro-inositol 1-dehydrogenase
MTNSRNKLRLGLIGCGRVTETLHLPALQHLTDAKVVAVADISKDRATKVADLFHIKDRYTDYQRLLKDGSIDAVAVCVPAAFHVEVALSALEVGKHVFVEKPLALELAESDLLVEQAKKSSCKITVGFNLRWHRLVRQARETIQRGTLGRLELMRTALTSYHDNVPEWRKQRGMGGGVLFEQAVHHFDLWRYLLQSEVEEVFASSRSESWDDESATVTARMANGVLAASVFSERTMACDELEIYGATGRLRVDCYRFDGLEYVSSAQAPGGIRSRIRKMANTLWDLPHGISKVGQGGDFIVSYRDEWRHFIDCIQRDAQPECTLEDGRHALQVVLAVIESCSLGKPVRVAQASRGTASTAARPGVRNESAESAALARRGN